MNVSGQWKWNHWRYRPAKGRRAAEESGAMHGHCHATKENFIVVFESMVRLFLGRNFLLPWPVEYKELLSKIRAFFKRNDVVLYSASHYPQVSSKNRVCISVTGLKHIHLHLLAPQMQKLWLCMLGCWHVLCSPALLSTNNIFSRIQKRTVSAKVVRQFRVKVDAFGTEQKCQPLSNLKKSLLILKEPKQL